jgi:hypothetical protein
MQKSRKMSITLAPPWRGRQPSHSESNGLLVLVERLQKQGAE